MTPIDFIESTIAGALGTHHPYHWMVVAVKWVCIHIAVIWGSIKGSSWMARIVPRLWSFLWNAMLSMWK